MVVAPCLRATEDRRAAGALGPTLEGSVAAVATLMAQAAAAEVAAGEAQQIADQAALVAAQAHADSARAARTLLASVTEAAALATARAGSTSASIARMTTSASQVMVLADRVV